MPSPDSSDFELRRATPSDIPGIVRLVESAYRGESSRAGWTTEADLLGGQRTDAEEIAELLALPHVRSIVAVRPGSLDGHVLLRRDPDAGYVGMLAVAPELQGAGLGKRLLAEAERCTLTDFGLGRTRMTVISLREELIAWYERHGYHRTGRREPFPYDNPRFGLPKRPDLEFVVLEHALDGLRAGG